VAVTVRGDQFWVNGRPRRLAGNHTWDVVQPIANNKTRIRNITGNFTRLWTVETRGFVGYRPPFSSNTPGLIKVENGPWNKDLSLNDGFYNSLRRAVRIAQKRDIVTGVVLFEGSIPDLFPQAWDNHPFKGKGPKTHFDVHTRGLWNKYQRAHVKRVVETLEPFDNVIYEVGNELTKPSVPWFKKQVVKWVRKWTDKPVGVSYVRGIKPEGGQRWMTKVGADWIAPGGPNKVAGFKGPQVLDTDHTSALRSNLPALQAAARDSRPIWLMDGFKGTMLKNINSLAPDRQFINNLLSGS
jgi:hypothetical protein